MRRSNMLSLMLVVLLASSAACQNQPLYDSEASKVELQKRFDRYSSDLTRLRQQVTKLKQRLNAARGDASLAVPALQQTIANERDILFNIQEYLQLPFDYTLCQCYNFTKEHRSKLREEISAVRTSIEALQKNAALEVEGTFIAELRSEVKRQLTYINAVDSILASKCCGKRNRFVGKEQASGNVDIGGNQYQTNIKAKNWIYDGMTAAELRLRYFSRSASWNVTNCPIETPFASAGVCIDCTGRAPYWSMRLERCVGCPKQSYYNATSRSCWKTYVSQQSSEEYHVVQPIREKEEHVAPLKGKLIKKEIISRRRTTKQSVDEVVAPVTGKKITTTRHVGGKSSKSSRWWSSRKSASREEVVAPLREAPHEHSTSS